MRILKISHVWMVLLALLLAMPAMANDMVDINTASAKQLQSVEGIGKKVSAAIIAYRDANGAFKSIDDLKAVKGIGKKRLAKIRPHVTVGSANPCSP